MYVGDVNNVVAAAAVVLVIFAVIIGILGIVMYIFQAIGMYSISRRRKLGTSGFAWIPILNWFKMGSIADDAVLHKRGTRTHFMPLMPIFQIAGVVLCTVGCFLTVLAFNGPGLNWVEVFQGGPGRVAQVISTGEVSRGSLTAGIIMLAIGYILILIATVMMYICLYHIFKSCASNYVPFFVISLIISLTVPFFLFAVRKKDNPAFYNAVPPEVHAE